MKKQILFAALFLLGCNYGSSISDQRSGNGGSTGTANGGSTGTDVDGSTGDSNGGATSVGDTGGAVGIDGAVDIDGGSGVDGGSGIDGGSSADGATTACIPAATGGPAGMNTGLACVSCHGTGQAPAMTAAGTVYSTATGGAAVAGATVTITDSNGTTVTMVTGKTGNFYTGSPMSFPATVQVSKCPDTAIMTATIKAGDCNSCHGSTMRVHLP